MTNKEKISILEEFKLFKNNDDNQYNIEQWNYLCSINIPISTNRNRIIFINNLIKKESRLEKIKLLKS